MTRSPKSGVPLLIAIDPGTKESAIMAYRDGCILWSKKDDNGVVLAYLRAADHPDPPTVVIESLVSYGKTVGEEVFTTAVWIGRFFEAWASRKEGEPKFLTRTAVKMHVCGSGRANVRDRDVREALIAMWGGEAAALGGPKCKPCRGLGVRGKSKSACAACGGVPWVPGPLSAIAGDQWSALAIAVTYGAKDREQSGEMGTR